MLDHYILKGVTSQNVQIMMFSDYYFFILANSVSRDEMPFLRHFILVFTVCQTIRLRVPSMTLFYIIKINQLWSL